MTVLRHVGRLTTVSALVVGMVPLGAVTGRAADPRLTTGLGGWSIAAEGSPLLVLLDDPKAAIPRPTGAAVVEADPNYTLAKVATGPNALGIASTLWPGNLLGTGIPALAPGAPQYPFKAETRYPDTPFTATGPDGGVSTSSSAYGLEATATADGSPTNKPGQVTVGDAFSTSSATVTDKDVAVGTVRSAVKDVSLLGGVIKIGSVTTTVTTTSDGKAATSTGSTTVSGLLVNGVGYTVDEKGLQVAGQVVPASPPATPDQLKELGITIEGVTQAGTKDATSATRKAGGLVIRIDTTTFKAAVKPVIDPLREPYATVVSSVIPTDQQGNFFYLLNATPSITFVFGAATASSAAVLPLSFDFGPPPAFPSVDGGFTAAPPTGTVTSSGPGFVTAPDLGGAVPPSVTLPPTQQPALQAPGATPVSFDSSADFTGIGASKLLLAALFAGGVGWLLLRLLGLAGGLPLGLGCRLGAPTSVPDLRTPVLDLPPRSVTA